MRALIFIVTLLLAAPAFALDHYELDKEHTTIMFFVSHLGFSDMVGNFTAYDGTFQFDPAKPEESTLDVTIKPSGIRTSSAALDKDLQGEKFFNTEKFPAIRFVGTAVTVTGADSGDVTGRLTLLGVTRPVILHVHFNKADYHPLTQDFVAGFHAEATLKRSDFGMNAYLPMVGDKVRVDIQAEGINIDRKHAERIKH